MWDYSTVKACNPMIFSQKKNECNIFALFTQDRYVFCSIDFFQDLSIYCYPFILHTGKSSTPRKNLGVMWTRIPIHSFVSTIQTWDANRFIVRSCIKGKVDIAAPYKMVDIGVKMIVMLKNTTKGATSKMAFQCQWVNNNTSPK